MSSESSDSGGFEEGTIGWAILQSDIWNRITPASRDLPGGFKTDSVPARVCSSDADDYLGDSIGFIATTPCPEGDFDLCLCLRIAEGASGDDSVESERSKAVKQVRSSALAGTATETVLSTRHETYLSAVLLNALSPATLQTRLDDLSKLKTPRVIEKGYINGIRISAKISTNPAEQPQEVGPLLQPMTFQLSYGLP